jgi:hypothetical protein
MAYALTRMYTRHLSLRCALCGAPFFYWVRPLSYSTNRGSRPLRIVLFIFLNWIVLFFQSSAPINLKCSTNKSKNFCISAPIRGLQCKYIQFLIIAKLFVLYVEIRALCSRKTVKIKYLR